MRKHVRDKRKAVGLTAATLLAFMSLQSAQAQLATDLDCTNCVGNQELAPASVFKGNIANFTITGNKIAPEAIGTGKIKDNAITSGKLAPDSVVTAKLKDGAVTADKLDPALSLNSGYISVSANGARATTSGFLLEQAFVGGRIGTFALSSAGQMSEQLVVPVQLPHGATITSFSYTIYDVDATFDSGALLYRDDNINMATALSAGTPGVMTATDVSIDSAVVDNSLYSYFVFMAVEGGAGSFGEDISPINAVIGFTY